MPETIDSILPKAEDAMKERVGRLARDLSVLRTGRANPQLVEGVKVEYYGQLVPLKQVAAVSVPEGRTLEIRPWDPSVLGDLEKAIQKADLGAMPQNDGKALRINLPAMTEDRRKELIKTVKRIGEEFRVGVRGERHAALESIKSAEKGKTLSEDQARGLEAKLQKLTDLYVSKVDQEVAAKEKEVSTI